MKRPEIELKENHHGPSRLPGGLYDLQGKTIISHEEFTWLQP